MKYKLIKPITSWVGDVLVPKSTIVNLRFDPIKDNFYFYYKNIAYSLKKENVLKYAKKFKKRAPLPLP